MMQPPSISAGLNHSNVYKLVSDHFHLGAGPDTPIPNCRALWTWDDYVIDELIDALRQEKYRRLEEG